MTHRGPYVVRPGGFGVWKVCDRDKGYVVAVAYSRRIAYLIRSHLNEVRP